MKMEDKNRKIKREAEVSLAEMLEARSAEYSGNRNLCAHTRA